MLPPLIFFSFGGPLSAHTPLAPWVIRHTMLW